MATSVPNSTPDPSVQRGWFSRRHVLRAASLVPASLALAAVESRLTAPAASAAALPPTKASSLREDFSTLPTTVYWGTDVTNSPYINGDGRLHMPSQSNYYSLDLLDWSNDTVSLEYVSGSRVSFYLCSGDWQGQYGFTYTGSEVWCNRMTRGGGSDNGFVSASYDSSRHRFCFLVQSGDQVLWQTAGSYGGQRTTLRTASLSDLGSTGLRLVVANRSGSDEAVVDNLNCYTSPSSTFASTSPSATVDFSSVVSQINPDHLGYTATGIGPVVTRDDTQAAVERALDARRVRLVVRWDGSRSVNGGGGAWPWPVKPIVDMYRSWGRTVVVCIAGRSGEAWGYQAGDATHIVAELGTDGVEYTGVNEILQYNGTMSDLVSINTQIWNDIQAAAPGTRLWGPTLDRFDRSMMFDDYLLKVPAGMDAGADYHLYGMWRPALSTRAAMAATPNYRAQVARTMTDLRDAGLPMRVMISEFNFTSVVADGLSTDQGGFYDGSGQLIDGRLFTPVQTTWTASVIGHVLRAGGMCLAYGSQAEALSLFVWNQGSGDTGNVPGLGGRRPNSSPTPTYWAMAMFTGGSAPGSSRMFPHFKNLMYEVDLATADNLVEVFALQNEDGGFNVVVVNKDTDSARQVTLNLQNVASGRYDAWQTASGSTPAAYAAPSQISVGQTYDRQVIVHLPACTVTTVVLRPGA